VSLVVRDFLGCRAKVHHCRISRNIAVEIRWYKIEAYRIHVDKLPVGILGATGIVGQRFIQMLEHHPWFEVSWLAASDRSEGRPYAEAARWRLKTAIPAAVANMTVSPAKPKGAPKIIFAALDAGSPANWNPNLPPPAAR
jgi:hypothetical protein